MLFSGFAVCHPVYEDQLMHCALRYATYSAILSNTETATFIMFGKTDEHQFLIQTLNAYTHFCCTLRTISLSNLNYATPPFGSAKKFYSLATTGEC